MAERTHSRSELVIDSLMTQLAEVRRIEDSSPTTIEHDFGNLKDAEHGRPPRVIWVHRGGLAVTPDIAPTEEGEPASAGYRVATYVARLWMPDVQQCEELLDQLVTASRFIDRPQAISFVNQRYEFPTQVEGKWLERGQIIDATVLIRSSVPAEPRGSTEDVTVVGSEWRAGIANPADEPDDEVEYDVDRWTG